MPLPERVIQPVSVSRGTLQYPVPDELEGVTNGTLANIIRQLSSLSRHAEEMFGNLFNEAEAIAHRSNSLQARIDRIAVRVTQLDSNVEEVSLQEIQLRKAFRSSQSFDQQVVSRETMPKAMLEAYMACDKPPPLDKLNPYREDGKDGLKFYTDSTYFFELWRQEMLKDTERMMHDRGKKHHGRGDSSHSSNGAVSKADGRSKNKRVRQPHNTVERHRQKVMGQGEYIMDGGLDYHQQMEELSLQHQQELMNVHHPGYDPHQRPNSIEIKRSYQNNYQGNNGIEEPIYTPRVLRNDPPSPQVQYQPQRQQQHQQHPHQLPLVLSNQQGYDSLQEQYGVYNQSAYDASPTNGTPTRGQRRPSVPPPAPPPGATPPGGSTPTRNVRSGSRDNLPPPPPPPSDQPQQNGPMQNVITQLHGTHHLSQSSPPHHPFVQQQQPQAQQPQQAQQQQPQQYSQNNSLSDDLPPPPPVPDNHLGVKIPPEHLPPSPPPPPAPVQPPPSGEGGVPPPMAPPPPPPPPPADMNGGNMTNGDIGKAKNEKSGSPVKASSNSPPKQIISPQGVRKPNVIPPHVRAQDGVRSDLLKAIRDGIALKKVAQREQRVRDEEKKSQTDVASILARRVAVEMSDSDDGGGPTDSEYDSDEWGDESTA